MEKSSISTEAKNVLDKIGKTEIVKNFYLAGGTALALQLNHRESVDLDWFSAEVFSNKKIIECLSGLGVFELNQEDEGTVHGTLDGVKVSFLFYSQKPLFPLVDLEGAKMASEKDIAAMKLSAISSRGSKKDFIDFYFLLKKYSLKELFEVFEKKYEEIKYNKIHLLKSLAYFDDAEEDPMPIMIENADWEKMKEELREKTADFLGKRE